MSSMELMSMVGLSDDSVILVRRSRLRWYGHRMKKEVVIRRALEFEVEGVAGRGRPRLGWREQVEKEWKQGYGMLRRVKDVIGDVGYLSFITTREKITLDLGEGVSTVVCVRARV